MQDIFEPHVQILSNGAASLAGPAYEDSRLCPKSNAIHLCELCVSAASALNVDAIMVNAESTETQSSQSRVKSYSKTLLGQGKDSHPCSSFD